MARETEERKKAFGTYCGIAKEFHQTRRNPWPSLKELGEVHGKRILDLGAGTGRNTRALAQQGAYVVAVEASPEMLRLLVDSTPPELKKGIFPVRCDALFLPFISSCFDSVAFVAAIHHIPGKENRRVAMNEVYRVTAPGGTILVTAWAPLLTGSNRIQDRMREASSGEQGDVYVLWGKTTERYYHLFSLEELEMVVESSGLTVLKGYRESISKEAAAENVVVVARKTL